MNIISSKKMVLNILKILYDFDFCMLFFFYYKFCCVSLCEIVFIENIKISLMSDLNNLIVVV